MIRDLTEPQERTLQEMMGPPWILRFLSQRADGAVCMTFADGVMVVIPREGGIAEEIPVTAIKLRQIHKTVV